jgi:hypothetical protein
MKQVSFCFHFTENRQFFNIFLQFSVTTAQVTENPSTNVNATVQPMDVSLPPSPIMVQRPADTPQKLSMPTPSPANSNHFEKPAIISLGVAPPATPQIVGTPNKTNELNSKHSLSHTTTAAPTAAAPNQQQPITPKLKKTPNPHHSHNGGGGSNRDAVGGSSAIPTKKSSDLLSSIMASMDSTQY